MPRRPRLAPALAAAALAAVSLLSGHVRPASALEPPRPLPDYQPTFVTETDTHPWTDCLWASGAMLLDKWTNGEGRLGRRALRALSGDLAGGSSLSDLRAAYATLGVDLAFSPDGGTTITWPMLLSRLEQGAGAVLLGDASQLPRWFGRWDPAFWKATGDKDNHAVYIERYDRRHGRVWLMDPLGSGDWRGEWISVAALRKYAWTRHGALSVAVTPTAQAAPFQGVTVTGPIATASTSNLDIAWALQAPDRWRFPGADVAATFARTADPVAAAAIAPAIPAIPGSDPTPLLPSATVAAGALHATAPLPVEPGSYQATVIVTDRRFGRVVARSEATAVFVPGPRSAALSLQTSSSDVATGASIAVRVAVANSGRLTWAEDPRPGGAPGGLAVPRATRLVARWVPIDVPLASAASPGNPEPSVGLTDVTGAGGADGASVPGDPDVRGAGSTGILGSVELGSLPLAPGGMVVVAGGVQAPTTPGTWALVVDVVDDVEGSFAALGSAPAVEVFHVISLRGWRGSA